MSSDFWSPVKLSLEIASVSVVIVFLFGIFVIRFMARRSFIGKTAVETLLTLPLVLPPTVVGFLLIVIFGINSPIGRLIEHVFGSPLIFSWWAAVILCICRCLSLDVSISQDWFSVNRSWRGGSQ